jgi:hypothetical protein
MYSLYIFLLTFLGVSLILLITRYFYEHNLCYFDRCYKKTTNGYTVQELNQIIESLPHPYDNDEQLELR